MEAKRINGFAEIKGDDICYYKANNGTWYLYHPRCGLGSLEVHEIIEHKDNTVTVSPSILINNGFVKVHGYLKKGIWKDC